jgi:S1-C subfamily serine protease
VVSSIARSFLASIARRSFFFACVVVSSGCAGSADPQLQENARERLRWSEQPPFVGQWCYIGFDDLRGTVTSLTGSTIRAGLRMRDRVISVDGTPVDASDALTAAIARHDPNGSVELTVSRAGVEETIEVKCQDGEQNFRTGREMLEAAAAGRWDDCIRLSWKVEQELGLVPPPASLGNLRCNCAVALAKAEHRPIGELEANLFYEAWRRAVVQAALVPGALKELRGAVLDAAEQLRRLGAPALGNELERSLSAAQHEGPPNVPGRGQASTGTCFAVAPDGKILTAHHVIEGMGKVNVVLGNGASSPATIEATSPNDLVLLKIPVATPEFLVLAQPHSARVGQHVFTIGFPVPSMLGSEPKFTEGSISALSGPQEDAGLIQISVPVQPGNSGGPLVNDAGEVVGILTSTAAISPFFAASGAIPQNVNWAVKGELAMTIVPRRSAPAKPSNRDDAIARVRRAVCYVEAVNN